VTNARFLPDPQDRPSGPDKAAANKIIANEIMAKPRRQK
jgi:hypothetical protein